MSHKVRPHETKKHKILLEYALRFNTKTFVETGTYRGDTVKAMLKSRQFETIHTVDIYKDRVESAKLRYGNFPCVHCWHGDSAIVLPEILQTFSRPALFWLDAHHSGKQIARKKGLVETPILAELECVLQHNENDIVIIDDAHYYETYSKRYDDYPSTEQLHDMVRKYRPDWIWQNEADIIRTHHADHA